MSPSSKPPDDEAIARDEATLALLIAGDEEGLYRLVQDHGNAVGMRLRRMFENTLRHHEIEEALARAVANLWRTAHNFSGTGTLRSWLAVIAHHSALSVLRERQRSLLVYLGDLENSDHCPTAEDLAASARNLLVDVQHCLTELPSMQRIVLQADLEAGGRAAAGSLAQQCKCSLWAIYAARARGRRQLKLLLQGLGYRVHGSKPRRVPDSKRTRGKR